MSLGRLYRDALAWFLVAVCLLVSGCNKVSSQTRSTIGPTEPRTELNEAQRASDNATTTASNATPEPPSQKAETAPVNQANAGGASTIAADNGQQENPLTIRLDLAATKESPTIDIGEPISVVVEKNTSDRIIRIWNPGTENGYYQLSFQFTNSRSGEKQVARKRTIDDKKYWKELDDEAETNSQVIEIAPADTFTTQVGFLGSAWGERAWTGLPGPNSRDRFTVSVQLESKAAPDDPRQVWTGKITSDPVAVRLVAGGLESPHDYLWNGFPERALEIMKADPKWIHARDKSNCTPLHHASRFRYADVVKWLLDQGADVNAEAYNGFTPLYFADRPEIVRAILDHHPDLTNRSGGQTPLQRATDQSIHADNESDRTRWREIANLYRAAGADDDILTAIFLDDLERVIAILEKSAPFADDYQDRSPLRAAASLGRLEICRYLIREHHVDVNDFNRGVGYPIIKVALAYPELVRLLIENRADLKTRITWNGGRTGVWIIGDDATALHYAAADGVPETIQLLIDNGVDIFATAHDSFDTNSQQTALEVAAYFGKDDNASTILNHPKFGQADESTRKSLLNKCLMIGVVSSWLAREADRPNLVAALLKKGADPNAKGKGFTAMQVAAREIHPGQDAENREIMRVISALKEYGADVDLFSAVATGDEAQVAAQLKRRPDSVNSRGPDGYPALHFAVGMNYTNIVKQLLDAGGDVNIRNQSEHQGSRGETALHSAAFWGRYEIAVALIAAGADVNAFDEDKSTPLHAAARMTNVKLARLLLEKGAKSDSRDKDNKTPLDCCRELNWKNAQEIEKIFRKDVP